MVATLSKNAAGTSWSLSNERSYDVWGSVRSGAVTGDPKGRYVANLGHVQDDESGLINMRARYYEPETGRFVSEDKARSGKNWYGYCEANPTNLTDETGNSGDYAKILLSLADDFMLLFAGIGLMAACATNSVAGLALATMNLMGLYIWFNPTWNPDRPAPDQWGPGLEFFGPTAILTTLLAVTFATISNFAVGNIFTMGASASSPGASVVAIIGVHMATLMIFMAGNNIEDGLSQL